MKVGTDGLDGGVTGGAELGGVVGGVVVGGVVGGVTGGSGALVGGGTGDPGGWDGCRTGGFSGWPGPDGGCDGRGEVCPGLLGAPGAVGLPGAAGAWVLVRMLGTDVGELVGPPPRGAPGAAGESAGAVAGAGLVEAVLVAGASGAIRFGNPSSIGVGDAPVPPCRMPGPTKANAAIAAVDRLPMAMGAGRSGLNGLRFERCRALYAARPPCSPDRSAGPRDMTSVAVKAVPRRESG
ncbi:MAG: hypothetical protein AUG49_24380 [Catenulispora sp. 13_1_20CM_3_70_7]|nr:MAG: hypothetical protein AUG49_24380 [Catenulispora sp. 13_1_20CM_3_70_7]